MAIITSTDERDVADEKIQKKSEAFCEIVLVLGEPGAGSYEKSCNSCVHGQRI